MEHTRELIRLAQQGDQEAKQALITENAGLIWSIVKRFSNRGYDMDDLYQIGAIGLLKCIEKFDFSYDVKLSTYAVPMMIGEIKRFFRDDGMLKVSRAWKELSARAARMQEEQMQAGAKEMTVGELAQALAVTTEELVQALEAGREIESLSAVRYEDQNGKGMELGERLGKAEEEEIVNRLFLQEALETLPPRERQIITLRYFADQTQTEIAQRLGISQVQVSRIEKKVLEQIRRKFQVP